MLKKISINTIPKYLKKSDLYKNFDKNDKFISIPKNKFEYEIKINNLDDLYKYLEICRYWMVNDCPHEIYNYVYNNRNNINLLEIKEHFYDLFIIDELEFLIKGKSLMYTSVKKGNLNLLKFLHKIKIPWNVSTCYYATESGNLDCLKYLHENGCPWDCNTTECAAVYGHLNCLKYAHKNGCPWDEYITSGAARYGHLNCLKYAHENGCQWDEKTLYLSNTFKKSDCLKYAIKNKCPGYEKYI